METKKLVVSLSCMNDYGINLVTENFLMEDIDTEFTSIASTFIKKMESYLIKNNCRTYVDVNYYDKSEADHRLLNEEAKADTFLHNLTTGKCYDAWGK